MISALKFECTKRSSAPIETLGFDDFLNAIKTDTPAKAECRRLFLSDKKKYSEHKRDHVPAWVIGATYRGNVRSNANVEPEGYVTVDFDNLNLGPMTTYEVIEKLSQCPHVLLAALSVSMCGVFCVIRTTPEVQTSPDKIAVLWRELSKWTGVSLQSDGGAHIDTACKDAARLRIESYDPSPYVNRDATPWLPFNELAEKNYAYSGFRQIALCFGGLPDENESGSARNAFALAALSMAARARVYGGVFGRGLYPFKAQPVVVGKSGAGKTTALNLLRAVAVNNDVSIIAPVSEAALCDDIAFSVASTPDKRETWTPLPEPKPIFEIIDEAGDERKKNKNREYAAGFDSLRRRLFDEETTLASAIQRKVPKFAIRAAYTNIQLSTPERWAESVSDSDSDAGNGRRCFEFWMKSPTDDMTGGDGFAYGRALLDGLDASAPTDPVTLHSTLEDLNRRDFSEGRITLRNGTSRWCQLLGFLYIDSLNVERAANEAKTAVASFATAAAYARKAECIEDEDLYVAWSLFYGVLRTRKRLIACGCRAYETPESRITEEILRTVETSKCPRYDNLKKKYASAGPQQEKMFQHLIDKGLLIVYSDNNGKKSRRMVRLATEEEFAAKSEPDFSEERKNRYKVDRGEANKTYSECTPEEKIERLNNYLKDHLIDNPMIVGETVDNSLRSLSCKLWANGMMGAYGTLDMNGMLDEVTEKWFRELAFSQGHTEKKDQDRLLRPIKEKILTQES